MPKNRRKCADCFFYQNYSCHSITARNQFSRGTHGIIHIDGRPETYEVPLDGTEPIESLAELCNSYRKFDDDKR